MRKFLAAMALLAAAPGHAAVTYTATILQTPQDGAMQGFGLNNAGDVVGGAGVGNGYQAYLRSANGSYQALGGFGGTRSTAVAIADNGVIAGQARTGATGATSLPFIKRPGEALTPIALPAGGSSAVAQDVNVAGHVVGLYRAGNGSAGFRWGEMAGFETLSGINGATSTAVYGVNGAGVAVGSYFNGEDIAFRWDIDGSVVELERAAVPSDIYYSSFADAINDDGLIAGNIYATGVANGQCCLDTSVFAIWNADGTLARTASLHDFAGHSLADINGKGDAVGGVNLTSFDPVTQIPTNESFAVLWRAGQDPINLNDLFGNPDLYLRGTFGINDTGQILAFGDRNGVRFDVLLTPLNAAVPEPGTWGLMILGFGFVGMARRRAGETRLAA
jgi:hypothetical protein